MTQTNPSGFTAHIQSVVPDGTRSALIQQVLPQLLRTLPDIAQALRSTSVSEAGSANSFGDNQLNVDVLAENIIRSTVAQCPSIVAASSEEDPNETSTIGENVTEKEQYTIAFDPLDGSSIIGPNWTVGTIIGIWDGQTAISETETPRQKQIAAILGVLGPRTTAVVAIRVPGGTPTCFEVSVANNEINIIRPSVQLQLQTKTRYFAPANLRAAQENPKYLELINHYISQKYTLRYSGGLVPDIFHALVKGHGVYISPITSSSPAKLRRLYELTPIALVIECAGGAAVDSADGTDILDRPVRHTDERGGLVCGNRDEVDIVRSKLLT
ncbi:fructose-1,6-bisphosphatase [Cucurbitaria berberidis CBS 394.84]|uniref:fructose-bisphosphatase n=1 Tax=Cucurbitaria berberidis CBS 394.84 TaxID=1168544 RepID=A0A9P4LC51_9PLEO|nr:fructose-1,6-bisphosphatase [Cucurbitaria berberidis CBS 394.84]KAF1850326.1 fructose-1,6-bisphosphatase [Cucurbitaria berberidis CBS 394.84]